MGNNAIDIKSNQQITDELLKRHAPTGLAAIAGIGTLCTIFPVGFFVNDEARNFLKLQRGYNSIFKDAAEKYLNENNMLYTNIKDLEKTLQTDDFLVKFLKDDPSIKADMIKCANGESACMLIQNKTAKIYANFDRAAVTTFHEMGHVKNSQKALTNLLQGYGNLKIRYLPFLLAFAGAILPDIEEPGENDSVFTKFGKKLLKFFNQNCIAISTLSYIPQLAEEWLATVKGNEIAKGLVPKELYKNVVKLNRKAMMTYIAAGIITTASVFTAKKVNDYTQKKLA